MSPHLPRAAVLLAVLVVAFPAPAQPPLPPPDKPNAPEAAPEPLPKPEPGVKVLEKGPIHEAFAQPGADVRGKDITAPKAPPPPIPELPPETKPDGENVKWIPGYWSWDADRNDFIWVSGFWRNVPPGREWQPGEWKKAADGTYAYSPGFWRPANQNNLQTDLPQPPKTVENGPNTPAQDPNAIWVPGNWEFRDGQYVWRPGYWAYPNGNMVWQPGQYVANQSGYQYVPGYWDYPLEQRGLLYAPVCFTQPLWQNAGWAYTPQYALGMGYGGGWGYGGLFSSLFIGPGWNNYYYGYGYPYGGYGGFGGLFGGSWLGMGYPFWGLGFGSPFFGLGGFGYGGYYPWYYTNRGYYNPMWHHYQWMNRNNTNYVRNVQNNYFYTNANRPAVHAPLTSVAGAASLGARAATNVARPSLHTPIVQPAGQVARSLAANHARMAAPAAAGVTHHAGGAGFSGGGVVINPTHPGVGTSLGSSPLHSGAIHNGGLGAGTGGVHIAPHAGTSIPSITQIHPGGTISPGMHLGTVSPGVTHSVPQIHYGTNYGNLGGLTHVAPQVHYGNAGGLTHAAPQIHYGGLGGYSSFPSVSGMHSLPSYHYSAPSFHSGGFGGGGIHMGGGGIHMGGGHMGGGGHGGGHGGHR